MYKKANNEDKKIIRKIAKTHGIKGVCQPIHAVFVGKQSVRITESKAKALVADLVESGFVVEDGWQGVCDTFLVWKAVN